MKQWFDSPEFREKYHYSGPLGAACGESGTAVYVQSVAELSGLGGIAPGDRFAGIVVSENVAEVDRDSDKTIKELLVKAGDDVTEGQILFSYDTDQLQLLFKSHFLFGKLAVKKSLKKDL